MEGRVGKAMTEAVAKALQARMFERKDGVWLFLQMVMDDAARVKSCPCERTVWRMEMEAQ